MYSAVSGAVAQQQLLDSAANNLANVNTTGFKSQSLVFKEVMQNAESPLIVKDKSFVRVDASTYNFQQGALVPTQGQFDVALLGSGFFVVMGPNGERYTRAGNFTVDAAGFLSTQDGMHVLGESGPILIGKGQRVQFNEDGEIMVMDESGQSKKQGRLKVAYFNNPSLLVPEGSQLFIDDNSKAGPISQPKDPSQQRARIKSGCLESSNVNAVFQMTQLIQVNRMFQASMKVLEAYQQVDSRVNNDMFKS